jgi:hypothetical protein
MGGFLPDFESNTSEGLADRKSLSIQHRRMDEKADGSRRFYERTLEHADTHVLDGGKWLISGRPNYVDRDKDFAHRNKREQNLLVTEKTIIDDGKGNITTIEDAFRTEDARTIKGTKLIGNGPAIETDYRAGLLQPFRESSDIFNLLSAQNKNSKLLKG